MSMKRLQRFADLNGVEVERTQNPNGSWCLEVFAPNNQAFDVDEGQAVLTSLVTNYGKGTWVTATEAAEEALADLKAYGTRMSNGRWEWETTNA